MELIKVLNSGNTYSLASHRRPKSQTHRFTLDIVNDILSAVVNIPPIEHRHKTRISYATNLTYITTAHYLDGMIASGLIENKEGFFRITKKGKRYQKVYSEIQECIQPISHYT